MSSVREAFVEAADHVIAIVARADVARAWREPSALADWSVGGLVAHLASQVPTTVRLLGAEPGTDPIPLDDHYLRSAWVGSGHESEVNQSIRGGGEELAVGGHGAVLAQVVQARAELPRVLAGELDDRAVLIPWAGWSMVLDDFLTGRCSRSSSMARTSPRAWVSPLPSCRGPCSTRSSACSPGSPCAATDRATSWLLSRGPSVRRALSPPSDGAGPAVGGPSVVQ